MCTLLNSKLQSESRSWRPVETVWEARKEKVTWTSNRSNTETKKTLTSQVAGGDKEPGLRTELNLDQLTAVYITSGSLGKKTSIKL